MYGIDAIDDYRWCQSYVKIYHDDSRKIINRDEIIRNRPCFYNSFN